MKILHIISQIPDFTGSGKYIQAVLKCAAKQGHDNFLVAGVQGDFYLDKKIISPDNTMFVRFDGKDLDYLLPGMSDVMPYKSTVFSTLTPSQVNQYERAFGKVLKKAADMFRPDIIHSHHLWLLSSITRDLLPGIPMVTTCHGTCLRQLALCPALGSKVGKSCKKIDRIMALSNYQKNEIIRTHSIPADQIDVVGGGYDETLFNFTEKPLPPPVEILYAGKLSYSKGLPWLLKSLQKLASPDSLSCWHLHIAGGGSGDEKMDSLALAAKLGNRVTIHGNLEHKDLSILMKCSHLFVLPSFFEGLPLVLMEALACGCRILTTSLPGTREVLGSCETKNSVAKDYNTKMALSGYRNALDTDKIYGNSAVACEKSGDSYNSMLSLVELPALESVDKPYDKDLIHLELLLSRHLAVEIDKILAHPEPDLDTARKLTVNYTWERIFLKIENVYKKALNQKDTSK